MLARKPPWLVIWSLVAGGWSQVAGFWFLVAGSWLREIGHQ